MSGSKKSPRVTNMKWGEITVEGISERFKDVKLYPGGAREWDWNETGTRHSPGIQPVDVFDLVQSGARIVVLSRGHDGVLCVMPETLIYLESKSVKAHVLKTPDAVNLYNRLTEEEPVGALIHSTC